MKHIFDWKHQPLVQKFLFLFFIGALLSGCVQDDDIEIKGNWADTYSVTYVISNDIWSESGTDWGSSNTYTYDKVIHDYDNDTKKLVYQEPANASYNANKFGRIQWVKVDKNLFYFCMEVYGKDSYDEAFSDPATSDASSPESGGCGSFPWTKMTRQ